tara:strand:- start:840 stop:1529 length:690 start_codon:yes stop_codon:yes gene_type:complete
MGRGVNKTGRSKKSPPFLMLPNRVLDHSAWRALTPYAKEALLAIARAYKGAHSPHVQASVRYVVKVTGQSKNRAAKSLAELQDRGFLDAVTRGHMGVDGHGTGTVWQVSFQPVAGMGATWVHETVWKARVAAENSEGRPLRSDALSLPRGQGSGRIRADITRSVPSRGTKEAKSLSLHEGQSIDLPCMGAGAALRRFVVLRGGVLDRHGVRMQREGSGWRVGTRTEALA